MSLIQRYNRRVFYAVLSWGYWNFSSKPLTTGLLGGTSAGAGVLGGGVGAECQWHRGLGVSWDVGE